MTPTTPIVGGIYDAGRGGTPAYRFYRLTEDTDPMLALARGARVPDGGYVMDFGSCSVHVSEADWHRRAKAEGHKIMDGAEFTQCGACNALFLAGDYHECPTPVTIVASR